MLYDEVCVINDNVLATLLSPDTNPIFASTPRLPLPPAYLERLKHRASEGEGGGARVVSSAGGATAGQEDPYAPAADSATHPS